MNMRVLIGCIFFCMGLLVQPYSQLFAQTPDSIAKRVSEKIDSVLGTDSALQFKTRSNTGKKAIVNGGDTVVGSLVLKIEELTFLLNKVRGTMQRGFDTTDIGNELPEIETTLVYINDLIDDSSKNINRRSLNASKVILQQINKELNVWQENLGNYAKTLNSYNADVKRVAQDGVFSTLPKDSILRLMYADQLRDLSKKWVATERQYDDYIVKIGVLQNRVGRSTINASDLIDDINYRLKMIRKNNINKEVPYLWLSQQKTDIGFLNSVQRAFIPNYKLMVFFISNNWQGLILLFLFCVGFFFWMRHNLKMMYQHGDTSLFKPLQHVLRSTLAPALLLFFVIAPFVENNPPAVYIQFFVLLMLLTASWLIWPKFSTPFKQCWLLVILLFILFGYDNILFSYSVGERWFLGILTFLSIFLGLVMLQLVRKNKELYPVFMDEVLLLYIVANLLSLLLNVFGRITMAKVLGNSAVFMLAQALALYLLVEILIESLYMQLEGNKHTRLSGFLQLSTLKNRLKSVFIFIATVIWIYTFTWTLNLSEDIIAVGKEVLEKPRNLGSIDFNIKSILIFGFVLYISFFISRMLTFFFGSYAESQENSGKSKFGSWILIIRLLVFTIGFLMAMGAAGIPIDKLTIVIGALGVGIGLGLQNIVSNLVSGVILAFEKPMDVGDVVEVGTRIGTVKEIGIRSSKISTYDGSDIIIPNSDFISKEVVNWTHSNPDRRVELLVGIAYGSEIEKAIHLINELLKAEADVLDYPSPNVLVQEFANSAITLRVLFWCNFNQWITIKSRLLEKIYIRFNEENINIPYQQTDLHIRSVSKEVLDHFKSDATDKTIL